MTSALETLPDDVESLQQLVLAQRAQITTHKVEIELLKLQIARLRRMKFGHSSEKIEAQINQLELLVEELETTESILPAAVVAPATAKERPSRKPLPEHLPRESVVYESACTCRSAAAP